MKGVKFTIPLPPVTKKNSQQIMINKATRRPFIVPSKAYTQYEKDASRFVPKGVTFDGPVNVRTVFYMPTRRRVDLTNLEEAAHDIFVKCGLLADDNRDVIAATDGSRVYCDKANPRTEVEIAPIVNYEAWQKQNAKDAANANAERWLAQMKRRDSK